MREKIFGKSHEKSAEFPHFVLFHYIGHKKCDGRNKKYL